MGKKLPRCTRQRCSKPARYGELCATHAKSNADRLFSRVIRDRDGACVRCGSRDFVQCAHKVSRRYLATRWGLANAVALCQRCHMWQTHNPLEGDEFFDSLVGTHEYSPLTVAQLKWHALNGPTPDFGEVIEFLRGRAAS